MARILPLLLAVPMLLGARGCDDDIDLGGDRDGGSPDASAPDSGVKTCDPEMCGGPPPPIACVDGTAPYTCQAAGEDAECLWVLDCPSEGEDCAEGACGVVPPGLSCEMGADEELTGRCIVEDSICQWETRSCECDDADCGGPPPPFACADGTVPYTCEREGGVCGWVVRECDCEAADCGSLPDFACVDGSQPYTCERAVDADGSCAWALGSCPAAGEVCMEGACGPLPPGLPCGGGVPTEMTGRCVVAPDESGCEWELRTCECMESDCLGDRPAGMSCADGLPEYWCGRQVSGECLWEPRITC